MQIRFSFSALPPLVRQVLGAAGGAVIAILLYTAFQHVPSFNLPVSLHSAADPAAAQEQKMDGVAAQARALLQKMEAAQTQMP